MKKGEKTAQRILDVAELKFAEKGFEKTNLREIADEVGIQQPGLYRHFEHKDQLYLAVLARALKPLEALLLEKIGQTMDRQALIDLPAQVFDIFVKHPAIAFLFQQALLAEKNPQNPMQNWIDLFFKQAKQIVESLQGTIDQQMLALRILALFNICIGFFVSRDVLDSLVVKKLAKNKTYERVLINQQKDLLSNIMEAWLDE